MRLTRQGYGALGVGAVWAVIGFRLGYAGVAAFGLGLLLFVAFSMFALRKPPPLDVRRDAVPAVPRRLDECMVTLTVRNRGGRTARLVGSEMRGADELEVAVPYLTPGRKIQVRYPLPTQRRGRAVLGPLRVRRVGLAGLAAGVVELGTAHTVTVLPRVLPAAGPGGPLTLLIDDRRASYPPRTFDFDEAVDAAASLVAAAAASGHPCTVRTTLHPTFGSPGDYSRDPVATVVANLATLKASDPPVPVPPRPVDGGVAVGVTGAAGDPTPMVAALAGAARAVLLVVDQRPDRMVSVSGNVLVLRAPRAEELLVAWDELPTDPGVVAGPRSGVDAR